MVDQKQRGVLLILTGPTGSGKDTVFYKLQERDPRIIKIITTTSRPMRQNERPGDPYHFLSKEVFEKKIGEKAFFEWVEFRGAYMGTQKRTLEEALASGKDVVWRIDTKGVKNIKEKVKAMTNRVVFVFLTAPIGILEQRVLRDEGELGFPHRWNESLVKWEMEQYDDCNYLLVNEEGKLDQTVDNVLSIMQAKRFEILLS
jgi:guanylate kinase